MGFSTVSNLKGKEYRYTEWVHYKEKKPDWSKMYGVELYDHSAGNEFVNVHGQKSYASVEATMRGVLHQGPTSGGGWGPWHKQ